MSHVDDPFGDRTSFKLLQSAQAGDEEALESLSRRYLPLLRRWAHGRLPHWARDLINTDDLIQDTMVRALDKVDNFEYRREGAFQAYLREGLHNRIRDEIRRVQRRPDPITMDEENPGEDTSPLEKLVGREALERYETALSRLKPEEREAVIARIELGLSYSEVAEALNKPSPDAARMTVNRALLRLAKEMAEAARP